MPIYRTKNEDFFKTWSAEMAYVLGFFTADGCMFKNKRGGHFLEFTSKDKEILEEIKKAMDSNHRIGIRDREGITYRVQIGSKTIFQDLINLGFTPTKSLTVHLPEIPNTYLADFTRGYFDGDGHISTGNYLRKDRNNKTARVITTGFTSGSKEILEKLHAKLYELAHITGGSLRYGSKAYRLSFAGQDSKKLYKLMYGGLLSTNHLYLTRKKGRFEKYFKIS